MLSFFNNFKTDIPHLITKSGEIQFHLAKNKNGAWIKLKNYFSTLAEAGAEKYTYLTLKNAADNLARKCHMYAVVHSILQVIVQEIMFSDPLLKVLLLGT